MGGSHLPKIFNTFWTRSTTAMKNSTALREACCETVRHIVTTGRCSQPQRSSRLGFPPLITEILPNENDDDHIIALFKRQHHWGAVAKSNFTGLRYREPVYRSLRELMMTYFEPYYNIKGERTMIGYTAALNLCRFKSLNWQVNDAAMEIIGDALDDAKKFFILSPAMKRRLTPVDTRSVEAGLHGAKQSGLYKP